MDVKPGAMVTVEITALPNTPSAEKTLARVCRKDPAVVRRNRYQDRHRPSWQTWRRGGRYWHHQMLSGHGVNFKPGTRYSVFASLDVIRDLQSVAKYVKVTA